IDGPIVDIVAYKDSVFYAYQNQLWEYRLATDFHSLVVDLEAQDDHLTSRIQRLAIDWENKRLYLLTGSSVTLVNFFGRGGSIISHRGTVTSIAVDPVERYLFYSELGSVKRMHLDGASTPKVIFTALAAVLNRNVQGGEAMALDPNIRTIYYIHERVLYSFNYEGQHSVVLNTQAPYARLEPFEDRLYANYRADASGLVSLHRTGYTFTVGPTPERRPSNDVTFHTTRPRAMSVLHVAKFPESHKAYLPCFRSEVCRSGWCFPLPDPQAAGHRCVCSPGEADVSCIRMLLHNYKPKNSLVSSAEINAAAGLTAVNGQLSASMSAAVTALAFVIATCNTLPF
ncbi:low-density lipoprotein receptor-related protein 2-like, partial [Tropilaelaps mercedesae]